MYNECRHLFISGKKCGSPALTAQNFCYYHTAARKRQKHTADNQPYDRVLPKETALPLPALDEGDAIQLAISEVVLALAANTIDPRRARILLYGLQIASQHYRHKASHCHPDRSRVPGILQNQDIVRETFLEEDGLELGPEKQSPDPEDIPEEEQPMTLGRYLLLEAIKEGRIDPERVRQREEEWKEQQARDRKQNSKQTRLNLQAVADEPTDNHRAGCPSFSRTLRKRGRSHKPHPNPHPLTTLQKHRGALRRTI